MLGNHDRLSLFGTPLSPTILFYQHFPHFLIHFSCKAFPPILLNTHTHNPPNKTTKRAKREQRKSQEKSTLLCLAFATRSPPAELHHITKTPPSFTAITIVNLSHHFKLQRTTSCCLPISEAPPSLEAPPRPPAIVSPSFEAPPNHQLMSRHHPKLHCHMKLHQTTNCYLSSTIEIAVHHRCQLCHQSHTITSNHLKPGSTIH